MIASSLSLLCRCAVAVGVLQLTTVMRLQRKNSLPSKYCFAVVCTLRFGALKLCSCWCCFAISVSDGFRAGIDMFCSLSYSSMHLRHYVPHDVRLAEQVTIMPASMKDTRWLSTSSIAFTGAPYSSCFFRYSQLSCLCVRVRQQVQEKLESIVNAFARELTRGKVQRVDVNVYSCA